MDDFAPLIERAFSHELHETSYEIDRVEGAIPDYIRGTYYLNGPARFSRAGLNYRHWFDGDGMVSALRFSGDRVHFANRFVRSAKLDAEEKAGHPLFRTFGTSFPGDQLTRGLRLQSPVNISVYPYRETLLAFGEQGLPVELDPVTLETRGEFDFGGALNQISPFSAHPKFDPTTGEAFNFGIAYSGVAAALHFYRFNGAGQLDYRKRLELECAHSNHDFGLSEHYAVFYLSPYVLHVDALIQENRTLLDSLTWEPERGSCLFVLSRDTGNLVARIPIGDRYCLHLINCFDENERLVVDVIELERPIYDQYQPLPNLFTHVCEGRPVRFTVNPKTRKLAGRREIDYRFAPDFPSIDQRQFMKPCEDFWMLGISATGKCGRKFFDQLVHASWRDETVTDVYQAPAFHYLSAEPIFIRDPGNDRAGAIICQIFDAQRVISAFAIFDAFNVAAGPFASVQLEQPINLGFHAWFNLKED